MELPEPEQVDTAAEGEETQEQDTDTTVLNEPDPEAEPAESTTEAAAKTEQGGFFTRLWDKLSGGDDDAPPPDAEVLQPELENK